MSLKILSALTIFMPLVVAGFKKAFSTDDIDNASVRKGLHGLIPVLTSIATVAAMCHFGMDVQGVQVPAHDWTACLTTGLAVGTTAGWIRDQAGNWGDLIRKILKAAGGDQ